MADTTADTMADTTADTTAAADDTGAMDRENGTAAAQPAATVTAASASSNRRRYRRRPAAPSIPVRVVRRPAAAAVPATRGRGRGGVHSHRAGVNARRHAVTAAGVHQAPVEQQNAHATLPDTIAAKTEKGQKVNSARTVYNCAPKQSLTESSVITVIIIIWLRSRSLVTRGKHNFSAASKRFKMSHVDQHCVHRHKY
ncbi:hypothetical protein AGLY_007252 [Aphis glycines]|uniref:Uncharacterized protein n=1 Tax=Aphis glycines TaxID=307491 RepID=A0A6G0TP43_APHGL|nr:hypothetical protein AGLY_007252 [Aphis glycines]